MTAIVIDRCVCRDRRFAELLPLAQAGAWSLDGLMLETGQTCFDTILGADPS